MGRGLPQPLPAGRIHYESMGAIPESLEQKRADASALPSWWWAPLVWYGALLIALFFPTLFIMVKEWSEDESMGHGFFVPLVAGYIIWKQKEEIAGIELKPHWSGWLLVVGGFLSLIAGTLGADFFMQRIGFLISMLGVLLATCGFPILKALAFPLFLLLFMIRIPLFIYSQITFPLQLFASSVAEVTLNAIGIPVFREGNILELPSQKLSVVEACSGIRSLLSLIFLSLAYGYFFERRTWVRVALFFATIPIAIGANAFRVSLTGVLSEYKKEWAEGAYHTMEGWVIFLVALVALVITHRLLEAAAERMERKGGSGAPVSA